MGKLTGQACASERSPVALDGPGSDSRPPDYNSAELNITYVTEPEQVATDVADALAHPDVTRVGLDIETTGGLKPWQGTIRTIQVAVEDPEPRQFVIDLWETDAHPALEAFENPEIEVVTFNGMYEQLHLLHHHGCRITNLYDVCYASREVGKARGGQRLKHSYRACMRRYLGRQISKTQQVSAWGAKALTLSQIRYGAMDVAGLLDLRRAVDADVRAYGVEDLVAEKNSLVLEKCENQLHSRFTDADRIARDRIIRGIRHSRTPAELEAIRNLQARMPLAHNDRQTVEAEYAARAHELRAA